MADNKDFVARINASRKAIIEARKKEKGEDKTSKENEPEQGNKAEEPEKEGVNIQSTTDMSDIEKMALLAQLTLELQEKVENQETTEQTTETVEPEKTEEPEATEQTPQVDSEKLKKLEEQIAALQKENEALKVKSEPTEETTATTTEETTEDTAKDDTEIIKERLAKGREALERRYKKSNYDDVFENRLKPLMKKSKMPEENFIPLLALLEKRANGQNLQTISDEDLFGIFEETKKEFPLLTRSSKLPAVTGSTTAPPKTDYSDLSLAERNKLLVKGVQG